MISDIANHIFKVIFNFPSHTLKTIIHTHTHTHTHTHIKDSYLGLLRLCDPESEVNHTHWKRKKEKRWRWWREKSREMIGLSGLIEGSRMILIETHEGWKERERERRRGRERKKGECVGERTEM